MIRKLLKKLFKNKHVNLFLLEVLAIAIALTVLGFNWNELIKSMIENLGYNVPSWFS